MSKITKIHAIDVEELSRQIATSTRKATMISVIEAKAMAQFIIEVRSLHELEIPASVAALNAATAKVVAAHVTQSKSDAAYGDDPLDEQRSEKMEADWDALFASLDELTTAFNLDKKGHSHVDR